MRSIKSRLDRLMQDARRIVWRPYMLFLTGQAGAYQLELHEWNGIPGSARGGLHTKAYTFSDKVEVKTFVDEMTEYWRKKYLLRPSDLLFLDLTIPTERKNINEREILT